LGVWAYAYSYSARPHLDPHTYPSDAYPYAAHADPATPNSYPATPNSDHWRCVELQRQPLQLFRLLLMC